MERMLRVFEVRVRVRVSVRVSVRVRVRVRLPGVQGPVRVLNDLGAVCVGSRVAFGHKVRVTVMFKHKVCMTFGHKIRVTVAFGHRT